MKERVVVWFAGLGWERMTLNKVAFSFSMFGTPIEIRWYGILITLGIVSAFLYTTWRGKRSEGIISDDILDVGIYTVICGVIGARLYYVLTKLEDYPTLASVFRIWEGGLGIYGGIIGGCLGILLACRIKKLKWRKLFDVIAPGVMLAQAVGRWGNFFNGEAYGYRIGETTRYFFFTKEFSLPSGEGSFFNLFRMGLYPNIYSPSEIVFVHPTFLYECVWNLIGFVLVNLLFRRKRFDGQIALAFFGWYGFGRMFIEGLRSDSLYILEGVVSADGLRISQCIGLLCFVGSVILTVIGLLKSQPMTTEFGQVRELPVRRMTETGEIVIESQQTEQDATQEKEDTAEAEGEEPEKKIPDQEDQSNGNDH